MTTSQPTPVRPTNGVTPHLSSPDAEVVERAHRRQFTASYKLHILDEAAACKPGGLGALLRREALYSSHLTTWRRQRDQGVLSAFQSRRGRPPKDPATAQEHTNRFS